MARMKVTVRVDGLKEIDRALGELSKRTAKSVTRRALVDALEPMAEVARQNAPVRLGHLRDSIIVTTKTPKGGDTAKAAFAEVMRAGGSREEARAALRAAKSGGVFAQAFMGPGRHPQAIFQEFGTAHHPPHAYMRPAFDSEKDGVVARLRDFLRGAIDKAVARAAKAAARKAAKG